MRTSILRCGAFGFVALAAAFANLAAAQVNSWTNPASGTWDEVSNWSLAVLPDSEHSVMITNSGWKAVAVNASTPLNFPSSMNISNLTIRGAWDAYNTLLLNSAGTAVPLTVSNGLTIADNAQIVNLDSGLIVESGTVTVTNAQLIQDGGFIRTLNASVHFFDSQYHLTNGLFEAGTVLLGLQEPSRIHQYGGTATITNLVFRSPRAAARVRADIRCTAEHCTFRTDSRSKAAAARRLLTCRKAGRIERRTLC